MLSNKNFQLKDQAFIAQPFNFVSREVHDDLSTLLEIDLLENGSPNARSVWQSNQLVNLLKFSYTHSHFWRQRLPASLSQQDPLRGVPSLKRQELNQQVSQEGSLFKKYESSSVKTYASSGSTGIPVKVHAAPQNARYNELWSLAQYFIADRSLNESRTFIKPAEGGQLADQNLGLKVERFDGWLGHLGQVFQSGCYKIIYFRNNVNQLIEELLKERVGYLACLSSHLDLLIQHGGEDLLRQLGIKMWMHHSDQIDQEQYELLKRLDIPVQSTYSCSEVGAMGIGCALHPGYYHVAHSNVIIEAGDETIEDESGNALKPLLVTHLHSYATPIIRYEVGDYGKLHVSCPCGHQGATLSHLNGRKKYFIKTLKGRYLPFPIFSKPLLDLVEFQELFIYQKEAGKVTVELGGRPDLSHAEKTKIADYLNHIAEGAIIFDVMGLAAIDWRQNPKRLKFVSYI